MKKEKTFTNYLMHHFKLLKDYFFLLIFIAENVNEEAGIKNNKKYFLPRGQIKNYNVLIDGRNFYDLLINNTIKQYDELRKASTGYGDDYTTGCLLDYAYFKRQLQTNCS